MTKKIKNLELDKLVVSGCISGYHYSNEEDGPGSNMRETERLVLIFPNGMAVKFNTFCSGSAENTVLLIKANSILDGFND